MKRLCIWLVAVVAPVVLVGCTTMRRSGGASSLSGAWVNSLGTRWTIDPVGSFEVDVDNDGHRDAWGTLNVSGSEVTIRGSGGLQPKNCRQPGVYRYEMAGETLQFSLVSDRCKLRKRHLLTDWHRK